MFGFAITGLLSAFILLPQAYYYLQAGRIEESVQEMFHITFSPLPTFLVNIFIPNGIYFGSMLGWGTIPLIFLITGFASLKKNPITSWLITIFVLSLILALGGHMGIQNLLGTPPFFLDKLRSHGQILILTFFSGVIIISYGIEAAIRGIRHEKVEGALWKSCLLVIAIFLLIPFMQNNYLTDMRDTLIALGKISFAFSLWFAFIFLS